MKNTILRSIGAGLAGIITGIVLSLLTDHILQTLGVIPKDNLWVSPTIIWFILLYRTVYNTLSCYVTAKLAPKRPMTHALVLGVIGTFVSIAGAIATRNMNLGPEWYAWTLAALTLPSAWLGGKLFVMKKFDIKKLEEAYKGN